MADKITKEMTIAESIQKHPYLAEVFMDNGMGCMGCPMAQMENIEQGCLGHGLNEEQIEKLLDAANKRIEKEEKNG